MNDRYTYLSYRLVCAYRRLFKFLAEHPDEKVNMQWIFTVAARLDVCVNFILNGNMMCTLDDLESRIIELEDYTLKLEQLVVE